MKKMILFALLLSTASFALTLDQVRADLKSNAIAGDSVEMNIRTTVNSVAGSQSVSVYIVQKGSAKSYTEIKTSFMSQRSIVNGSRMKVIDLKTNKFQILPYNGEVLKAMSYANFNPLDSGEWSAPKFVSENLYSIAGEKGTLYYDAKKKRIEKLVSDKPDKSVLTTFEYDVTNNLKTMNVSVDASGVQTTITTEILKLRSSKNFPDRMFEF